MTDFTMTSRSSSWLSACSAASARSSVVMAGSSACRPRTVKRRSWQPGILPCSVTAPTATASPSPWLLIVTVWLTLGVAFGLMFSFSVFLVPLLEEFGWSRGLAAGAFSLSAVVQGLLSPAIGALVDRFGARRLILWGVVALGTSSVLGSRIDAVWHLYVVTGVLTA